MTQDASFYVQWQSYIKPTVPTQHNDKQLSWLLWHHESIFRLSVITMIYGKSRLSVFVRYHIVPQEHVQLDWKYIPFSHARKWLISNTWVTLFTWRLNKNLERKKVQSFIFTCVLPQIALGFTREHILDLALNSLVTGYWILRRPR